MAEVGQGPVSLSREVPGFVLNRMQVGGKLNVNHFFGARLEFSRKLRLCQYALSGPRPRIATNKTFYLFMSLCST